MNGGLLEGERELLDRVVAQAAEDGPRLAYADWLAVRNDARGEFLRVFARASQSMNPAEFPAVPTGVFEEWLELIGFRLLERAAKGGFPELKQPLLRYARPALRMIETPAEDESVPVAASKVGGLPDLPPDFAWPLGRDCRAIYNADTGKVEKPAGFLAQVNFAEIADTQAGKSLPATGVLSIFSYVNWKNPDVIGAMAAYFPIAAALVRRPIPENFTQGNRSMASRRLTFVETLDVPDSGGPWKSDMAPDPDKSSDYWKGFYEGLRDLNLYNFLGYGKSWQERDPTPNKDSRHLLLIKNVVGIHLHLQLPAADLAAGNFGAITLNWVDFD